MQVVKLDDGLAVRISAEEARSLGLREGDAVELRRVGEQAESMAPTRDELLARVRALQQPLPAGWQWDRDEANERR